MKFCSICERNRSKYKCPKCREPYCSVACCEFHKIIGCSPVNFKPIEDQIEQSQIKYNFSTEDTVPVEKLKLLHQSKKLRNCLKNLHIRDIMKMILNSKDPTKSIEEAMTEPAFVEMVDACLEVVEPPDDEKPC